MREILFLEDKFEEYTLMMPDLVYHAEQTLLKTAKVVYKPLIMALKLKRKKTLKMAKEKVSIKRLKRMLN